MGSTLNEFFEISAFAGVTLSLLAYALGMFLKRKTHLGIFNPLLVSIAVTIVVLLIADVDYDTYNKGASYLSWFLTPATVCLAIPLYEQIELLKTHWKAVIAGILSGVLTSLVTVFVLSKIMSLSHQRVCHNASKVNHNGYRHGSFRGVRRICDYHGSRYYSDGSFR